eukprot:CAMPEP_0182437090 /NCGR_PEP_ID=MMETSP1167-20130531/84810_1 /TAXON_ID=2988 /ORGANISM="Mallomonas Sp, Strain CCMP3275" /LENGTH=241 /DNA_ID=CAMNT_0024629883 /DNA_START=18 /DNA_END=743 /DNA_ORIENTATION=+
MVIAGVVRNVGVKDPIDWVRRLRRAYVETREQEEFVSALPLIVDSRITLKHPKLAQALTAQHMLEMVSRGSVLTTGQLIDISEEELEGFAKAFDLYDSDKSGYLSHEELRKVFIELGATVNVEKAIKSMDTDHDGQISKNEFLKVMAYAVQSSGTPSNSRRGLPSSEDSNHSAPRNQDPSTEAVGHGPPTGAVGHGPLTGAVGHGPPTGAVGHGPPTGAVENSQPLKQDLNDVRPTEAILG